MIATCPACGKRYRLPDEAVPAAGRNVRCAACGHGWTALAESSPPPPPPPAELQLPFDPPPVAAPAAPPVTPHAMAGVVVDEAAAAARGADADDAPPRRRRGWLVAVLFVALALAALAIVEFAPADTFDPPRLGLPAARLPLADLGSLSVPSLPPLDLARVPVIGDRLDALVNPPPAPPSPLHITASGVRQRLANGTWVLTVSGAVANPTDAPVTLAGIDAVLVDPTGHLSFRWRITAPASTIGAHGSATFESTAANFPPAATRLRLTPR